MNGLFDYTIWSNTVKQWLLAAGIIAGCAFFAKIVQSLVIVKIRKAALATRTTADDFIVSVLQRAATPFFYLLGIYFGLQYLNISSQLRQILHAAILCAAVYFAIRIITGIIAYLFKGYLDKRQEEQAQQRQARGILLMINIVVWLIGIVFLIDNLGYDITTIVAGLGIGGIAIALASQAVLADLFSYLVIFFDKPFETGDFIIIGDKMGVVEHIGIKTTRLRALGGEQLIIANTDLTNSRVQNYKRMERRRVVFSLGIVYESSPEQLRLIPSLVKRIIELQDGVQFDRAHFSGFGDFSLNFEVVYYILTADYNMYMDCQQAIYLAIAEEFAKKSINFAYPTQKLFLHYRAGESGREMTQEKVFSNTSGYRQVS